MKTGLRFLLFFAVHVQVWAQTVPSFYTPADTLNPKRMRFVALSQTAALGGSLAGLSLIWYKDYSRSKFHFINDNNDWLQMDKAGHVYSAYHLSRLSSGMYRWAGADQRSSLLYGAGSGFLFLTAVEVMDGYSAEWGASWGDVVANAVGSGLYVTQQLIWDEQRITPKFSFHTTSYAADRPEVFGSGTMEQILKDYNGQTYWLSFNIRSFAKSNSIPKWLNVAVGYGGHGMTSGTAAVNPAGTERQRQYYLALDMDLSRIQTKSAFVNTVLEVINSIKIPAPTVGINSRGAVCFYPVYF